MLNQIKTTIDKIKDHMISLDNRITLIEQDIVERHIDTTDEMEEDSNSSTTSTDTIISPNTNNKNQDIRDSQIQLNGKLEKIEETMSQMFTLFNSIYLSSTTVPASNPNNIF